MWAPQTTITKQTKAKKKKKSAFILPTDLLGLAAPGVREAKLMEHLSAHTFLETIFLPFTKKAA